MKAELSRIPLRWRVFLAASITVTILFAVAGWGYSVTPFPSRIKA